MKPGPKPLLGAAMTQAERQARYRASLARGATKLRYRRPADRRGRAQRWRDAVAELMTLQGDYQKWLDALPEGLVGSPTAEALSVICDLELSLVRVPKVGGRAGWGTLAPVMSRSCRSTLALRSRQPRDETPAMR